MYQLASAVADTICRTIELGVTIAGAAVDSQDRTRIFCEVLDADPRCPNCRIAGQARDKADRLLTDTPAAGHPVLLHVAVPRFVCHTNSCPTTIFRATIEHIAGPRAVVTSRTTRWILQRIVQDKMSVAAIAKTWAWPGRSSTASPPRQPETWSTPTPPTWAESATWVLTSTSESMFAATVTQVG